MQPLTSPPDIRLGTDIVFIPRLQQRFERFGESFFLKLLTKEEWQYCLQGGKKRFLSRAAARIATKEAVAKALGCGLNGLGWGKGVDWRDIEVLSAEKSPPLIHLHNKAARLSREIGIQSWRLSLSHDGDYAVATVIGL